MKKLIEALQIFLKYGDEVFPIQCQHDILYIYGECYDIEKISVDDVARLDELGFLWDLYEDCWKSYRFGSC